MARASSGKRHEIIRFEVVETGYVPRVRGVCVCGTPLSARFDRLRAEEEARGHVEAASQKGAPPKETGKARR